MTKILHTRRSMKILIPFAVALVLVVLHPTKGFAQPALIPANGMIGQCSFVTGDFGFECIPLYLAYLIRLFFGLCGGFALFNIMQGGYEYAISGVAAEVVAKEAAVKRIRNAVIGLIVVLLVYLIIDTIVSAIFVG